MKKKHFIKFDTPSELKLQQCSNRRKRPQPDKGQFRKNLGLTSNLILKIWILSLKLGTGKKNVHSYHFSRGLSHWKKQRIEIMAQR